jgi:hypothetical protein
MLAMSPGINNRLSGPKEAISRNGEWAKRRTGEWASGRAGANLPAMWKLAEGCEISAEGFNPGLVDRMRGALKVAPEGRAHVSFPTSPGLKPWAKLYLPFSIPNPQRRCDSDLAQYSHTPILHHSAWPDSRTRTTTSTKRLVRAETATAL